MSRSKSYVLAAGCLLVGLAIGTLVYQPILHGQVARQATAIPKELTSYRDVAKKVLPAVVSIETKAKPVKVKRQLPRHRAVPDDMHVPEEFRKFFEGMDQMPFEMPEQPHQGMGSGFLVDAKGVILTNYHVVAGADQVEVTLADGRKFVSKDIHTDKKSDLAIVRIKAPGDLPYLELGDSEAMEIGDRVLAAGAPFGLTGSVTCGIISAKKRNGLAMNMYEDFLQTDAAINPGNSGGPLVNLEGKVIGINAAIKTRSGGFQGVGLAISSNLAKNVMTQLLKNGVVKRGYLGVQIKDLVDADVAARLGVKEKGGVLVAQVFDKAPAGKGGVQAGDVITTIDGKPVTDGRALQQIVAGLPVNQATSVGVIRDGKTLTLKVTIEDQPEEFGAKGEEKPEVPGKDPETTKIDKVGIEVADLSPELTKKFGYKDKQGVVVTSVEPGSLADNAGLRVGTLVTKVDRQAVRTATAFRTTLEKGSLDKGLLLQTLTPQGGVGYVLLRTVPATK